MPSVMRRLSGNMHPAREEEIAELSRPFDRMITTLVGNEGQSCARAEGV